MESSRRFKVRPKVILAVIVGSIAVLSLATAPGKPAARGATVLSGAQVDREVLSILERSCQDCHSETTHYPWYSYVAPVSLLIQNDVNDGRKHMNLSRWPEYSIQRKERILSEIANQVKDGDMPVPIYTWVHRNARLSNADIDALFRWTQAERSRLIAENPGGVQ